MNTSLMSRLIAAAAAAVTTWSMLVGVVSLGQPAMPAEVTLAHRPSAPAMAVAAQQPPATVVVASNERH